MKTFITLFSLSLCIGSFAQEFSEFAKVVASDRDTEDRLGWSVDIDGNRAIVGAYADDFGGSDPNMGSAYIYEKEGGEWVEVAKIFNSDQDDYDRFGWSVAIHGDLAVIGAYGEDHDASDGAYLSRAGSAYIFERNEDGEWVELQKIVAGDRAADDEFGWSVGVYGTTVVVGAHIDDKDEEGMGSFYHAGSVYIFDQNDAGVWTETQKIVASDRSPGFEYEPEHEDWNDRFGEFVGIWNDYLVVGGPFASKAYMFERTGDTWNEVAYLTYPGISWLDRAAPVSIDSTTLVLGASTEDSDETYEDDLMNAGGAFIYKRIAGEWTLTQKIVASDRSAGDHFGISVSIDGDNVVVGAHQDNHDEDTEEDLENAGSIYLFQREGDGDFVQTQKLDALDRAVEDQLGISISISGNTFISGAFQQDYLPDGTAYLEDAGAAYFYSTEEACDPVFTSISPSICAGGEFEVGTSIYSESGTYTDTLTAVSGCDSIITTDLTVEEPIESEREFFLCFGETIEVDGIEYSEEGLYVDLFTTEEGCDSIVHTVVEVSEELDLSVEVDGIILTSSQDGVDYQWIDCDTEEEIDGATSMDYTVTENGTYAVILIDEDCEFISECMTVDWLTTDNENAFDLSIYPNPNQGQFILTGIGISGAKVIIYDPLGKVVHEEIINSDNHTVNLPQLSSGYYTCRLVKDEQTTATLLRIE